MDQLTNTERLLLAQAVYQEGANDWTKVSQIISNHPLIGRPKSYFSPSICGSIYASMVHAAGLDGVSKDNAKPRADVNRKLAEAHYAARVTELRDLIFQEETRFKAVLAEIEEIRSGLWDERIKVSLGIASPEPAPDAPTTWNVPEVHEEPTNEVEDSPMIDAEPPEPQDEQIIIDDSDVTTDEPPVTQHVSQALEEEEVDLHLTPNSVPPSPKPIEEVAATQEQVVVTPEEPPPPVQEEAVQEEAVQEEVVQEEAVQEETIQEEAILEEIIQEEVVQEEVVQEEVVQEEAVLEETIQEEVFQEEVVQEEAAQEEIIQEEAVQDEAIQEEAVQDEAIRGEAVQDEAIQDDAVEEEAIQDEATQEEAEPQSPFTEQDPEEHDAEGIAEADVVEPERAPSPPAPPEEAPVDGEAEPEGTQEAVPSEKDEPETGAQTRRGKRKADAEADPKREKKKSREVSEPLEESEPEPAPTKKRRSTNSEAASRIFQNVISLLHDQICQLRNGSIFHGPVKISDAPDYYDIVRRPIDLKAIKARIRDGQITNSLEYQRDIYLMFANSMMYNRPDSDLYKMAEEMMLESEQLINQFRQTEGWNQ